MNTLKSGITVGSLERHGAGADGRTGGHQSTDGGDDSDGNFMRFDDGNGENQ